MTHEQARQLQDSVADMLATVEQDDRPEVLNLLLCAHPNLLRNLDYGGSANEFAAHLVMMTQNFGGDDLLFEFVRCLADERTTGVRRANLIRLFDSIQGVTTPISNRIADPRPRPNDTMTVADPPRSAAPNSTLPFWVAGLSIAAVVIAVVSWQATSRLVNSLPQNPPSSTNGTTGGTGAVTTTTGTTTGGSTTSTGSATAGATAATGNTTSGTDATTGGTAGTTTAATTGGTTSGGGATTGTGAAGTGTTGGANTTPVFNSANYSAAVLEAAQSLKGKATLQESTPITRGNALRSLYNWFRDEIESLPDSTEENLPDYAAVRADLEVPVEVMRRKGILDGLTAPDNDLKPEALLRDGDFALLLRRILQKQYGALPLDPNAADWNAQYATTAELALTDLRKANLPTPRHFAKSRWQTRVTSLLLFLTLVEKTGRL